MMLFFKLHSEAHEGYVQPLTEIRFISGKVERKVFERDRLHLASQSLLYKERMRGIEIANKA